MVPDGCQHFRRAGDLFYQSQRMASLWHEHRDYQFGNLWWKQLLHHLDLVARSALLRSGQEEPDGPDVGRSFADNYGDRLFNHLVFAVAIAISLLQGSRGPFSPGDAN